jgi:hypothetical protein
MLTMLIRFSNFFSNDRFDSNGAQPLGFDGFFRGAFSYHFHNFWFVIYVLAYIRLHHHSGGWHSTRRGTGLISELGSSKVKRPFEMHRGWQRHRPWQNSDKRSIRLRLQRDSRRTRVFRQGMIWMMRLI